MSNNEYIYAVARIRMEELKLLSGAFLDQLISAKGYEECIQLILDRGWGDGGSKEPEVIFAAELNKTWGLIRELVDDMTPFDVFLYSNDYHNLKAAVKEIASGTDRDDIYVQQGTVDPRTIRTAIREKRFDLLPARMRKVAESSLSSLLHTGDGQMADVTIDRAALEAIYEAGRASKNEILRLYGELTVAAADLKIAVRGQRTGKNLAFMKSALAPCSTLDVDKLSKAAVDSFESILGYLSSTRYSEGADELKVSPSAFERWCDNLMIRAIRPQIHNPFSIGPLAAYILARENEIKTVRIVLSGKLNDLEEDSLRERVREMYV